MRSLLIVSTSQGKAAKRAAATLDRYLPRQAPGVWMGLLSTEAEEDVQKALRSKASRQTQIVCRGTRDGQVRWIVGSRRHLNADGCPAIHVRGHPRGRPTHRAPATSALRRLFLDAALAALTHDLGKGVPGFQKRLRQDANLASEHDAVRHEVLSLLAIQSLREHKYGAPSARDPLRPREIGDILKKGYRPDARSAAPAPMTIASWLGQLPWNDPLLWSVLCHHKLPGLDLGAGALPTLQRHLRPVEPAKRAVLKKRSPFDGSPLPQGPGAPWHPQDGKAWIRRVQSVVRRRQQTPEEALPPGTTSLYVLPALVMGDHLASAEATQTIVPSAASVLAKSDPPQGLVDHLLATEKATLGALHLLTNGPWRGLAPGSLPGLAPGSPAHPRFGWQSDACALMRQSLTDEHGFLGMLIARTGSGKTKAAAVLAASRQGPARWTLLLGLRSLTRQAYDAYRTLLGIDARDLALRMGGVLAMPTTRDAGDDPLDDGDERLSAEETDDILAQTEEDDRPSRFLERFCKAAAPKNHRRLLQFLTAPVAVATVDTLAHALGPSPHAHMRALLRLSSADVILDEIDGYDAVDQAALLRVVYAAAAYGRRVFLLSATMPEATAEAFRQAYMAGYALYRRLRPGPDPGLGVFSDLPGVSGITLASAPDEQQKFLQDRLERQRRMLETDPPPRRIGVLPIATAQDPVVPMLDGIRSLHRAHATVVDGTPLSVGFIRCGTVDAARRLAREIGQRAEEQDVRLRVLCYHARLPTTVRDLTEHLLDDGLRRGDNALPLASHPIVRRSMAGAPPAGLAIVVVCTPILETGRDHDYDWAILDVSEARAVIQGAGRVRRHRPGPAPTTANVVLLDETLRHIQSGQPERYRWPGIQTPAPTAELRTLAPKHLDIPPPIEALGLTATETFPLDLVFRNAPLQNAERQWLQTVLGLAGSQQTGPLGVQGLTQTDVFDSYTYRKVLAPFRPSGGPERRFWPEDGIWKAYDPKRPHRDQTYRTNDVLMEDEIPGALLSADDVTTHRAWLADQTGKTDARFLDGMDVQDHDAATTYVYTLLTGLGRANSRWRWPKPLRATT